MRLPNVEHTSEMRPVADDPFVGLCLGGRLLVEQKIGEGALGVVYRARHLHLAKPVAVKVLHDHLEANATYRERFHAEARTASSLDHPNLVRILDFGEEKDGRLWLAMELLEGSELEEVLVRAGHLPMARAIGLVLEVAAGLAHAHAGGVVHGDVKPANVVLVNRFDDDGDEREGVKLCDFGFARGIGGALLGGTPQYMSPEQCVGHPLDPRSDVYAVGIVLYELVTGALPFDGNDAHEILREQLVVPPVPPSRRRRGLDARIDAVVMKALAKDPASRHQSMRELRAELKDLLAELGGSARASTPPPPPAAPADEEFLAARAFVAAREKRALAELLETGDPEAIAARVARLSQKPAKTGAGAGAGDALALLDDPRLLAPLAESLLARDVASSPYLDELLARAGLAAARALWTARVVGEQREERRARFVAWLTALGDDARPVLLVGLKKLAGDPRRIDLLEDLLLVVPRFGDAELLRAVEPFLASQNTRVRRLAESRVLHARRA